MPAPGTAMAKIASALGKIEQRLLVVVYTPRHDAMRIISARKANQREVRHYEDSTRDD
ncbi:MAG: BrnT family toxin [Azonexus sp.]|nr:BrnT family toxin [Azonexus sp.]